MIIRIAQKGITADSGTARSLKEVVAGVAMQWIELDGHRFSDVISADLKIGPDEFMKTRLELEIHGPVELVYVDHEGEELGGVRMDPRDARDYFRHLDYKSIIGRQDDVVLSYLDNAIRQWRADTNPDHDPAMRSHYIDAFQSARVSLYDELLPEETS